MSFLEIMNGRDHLLHLVVAQLGIHRQRENFACRALGLWKRPASQPAGVRGLEVGGNGVVHERADTALVKEAGQAVASRGADVTIDARRREQASEVAHVSGASIGAWPPPGGSWDLLVNCTPLGGANARHESPLPGGPFTGKLVYDLTYGEQESPLLREAREAGCLTLDGLPMLVAQAEHQFEWWIGQQPRPGVMEAAVRGGQPCT